MNDGGQRRTRLTCLTEQSRAESQGWSFSLRSWSLHVCTGTSAKLTLDAYRDLVLANARVAGLLATDDIGVVSLLLFWGMVELGVGIIAICLPTLRPMFRGWSPESILRSIRSALSLRSLPSGGSGSGARRSPGRSSAKEAQPLGSDSSIVGIHTEATTYDKGSTEGVVTRAYGGEEGRGHAERHGSSDIRVDREVIMSRQEV